MPSSSPIRVSVTPHRSRRRYQSALLRATRETSMERMRPTWPKATSVVIMAKPWRSDVPEPERARSSSTILICDSDQPKRRALLRQLVLSVGGFAIVLYLGGRRLADIDIRAALQVGGFDSLLDSWFVLLMFLGEPPCRSAWPGWRGPLLLFSGSRSCQRSVLRRSFRFGPKGQLALHVLSPPLIGVSSEASNLRRRESTTLRA